MRSEGLDPIMSCACRIVYNHGANYAQWSQSAVVCPMHQSTGPLHRSLRLLQEKTVLSQDVQRHHSSSKNRKILLELSLHLQILSKIQVPVLQQYLHQRLLLTASSPNTVCQIWASLGAQSWGPTLRALLSPVLHASERELSAHSQAHCQR